MEELIEKPFFTHRQFAVSCFNKVWDLLDSENRTERESEEMVHLCHSSFWHWTKVEDHTPTNLSIGYWQLSRVYAVIGQGDLALLYAKKCLDISHTSEIEPFYTGYAYEAAARAYLILNQHSECLEAKNNSLKFTAQVSDEESKGWLIKDLNCINPG